MFIEKNVKEQKGKTQEIATIAKRQNRENQKIEKIEGLFNRLKIIFADYQELNIAKILADHKIDQLYRKTLLDLKIIKQHPENKRSYIWDTNYEITDDNIKIFLDNHRKRKIDLIKNQSLTKVTLGKNLEKIKLNPTRLDEISDKLKLLTTDIFNDKNMYAFNNYGFTPEELDIMKNNNIIQFRNADTGGMFKYITNKTISEVAKIILFNLDKMKKISPVHDTIYLDKVLKFLEWLYFETVNDFVNPRICEKLTESNLPKLFSKAVHELEFVKKEGKCFYKWVDIDKIPEKKDAIALLEKEKELMIQYYQKAKKVKTTNEQNNNIKDKIVILDVSGGPLPPNTQIESKIETLNSVLLDCVKEEKEALENILNQHPEFLRWQKLNNILNSI